MGSKIGQDCRESVRVLPLCVFVTGGDLPQGQCLMVERNHGLGLCKGPVLSPSSMRLQSWLPRATLWGWNETKQRPFCGAGFLKIAMAGLHEAPPQPAMSQVLCSKVFLCLVSWHRLRDVEEVELGIPTLDSATCV